jgi:predicted ester cyclase
LPDAAIPPGFVPWEHTATEGAIMIGCVAGKLDVIDEVFAEGFVNHDPMPGHDTGREGMRQTIQMLNDGLSDRKMVLDEYRSAGDTIVENAAVGAIHTGEMLGFPASGAEVRVRSIEIWRVAGGKITERWGVVDVAGLLAQLSTTTAAAGAAS